jgi:hypothetical protein
MKRNPLIGLAPEAGEPINSPAWQRQKNLRPAMVAREYGNSDFQTDQA